MYLRKKWMHEKSIVTAKGDLGIITYVARNIIGGVEYVRFITVRLFGDDTAIEFSPEDVQFHIKEK